jgi:hypothetical protein
MPKRRSRCQPAGSCHDSGTICPPVSLHSYKCTRSQRITCQPELVTGLHLSWLYPAACCLQESGREKRFGCACARREGGLELKDQEGDEAQQSRYETSRQVSGDIASQADLDTVLEKLVRFLAAVVRFEFLAVILRDAQRQTSSLYAFGGTLTGRSDIGKGRPRQRPRHSRCC